MVGVVRWTAMGCNRVTTLRCFSINWDCYTWTVFCFHVVTLSGFVHLAIWYVPDTPSYLPCQTADSAVSVLPLLFGMTVLASPLMPLSNPCETPAHLPASPPPPSPWPFLFWRTKYGFALSVIHNALANKTSSGLTHISTLISFRAHQISCRFNWFRRLDACSSAVWQGFSGDVG